MLKSLYKPLAGIYNLGAFGVIGELVRLWGQRSEVKVMARPHVVSTLEAFLMYIWNAWNI